MIQFEDSESSLNLQFEEDIQSIPGASIKVVGVGGAGGNAVNRMIESGISGVDFVVANTDAQALRCSKAPVKVHIGAKITKGLGAGAKPEIGREAALEDTNAILEHLEGADMVFVTAGLGGGTGTGAAPIIASLASELGALVVAVVTTPFTFEGPKRKRNATSGLKELKGSVDTVITISNDKLLTTVPDKTPFTEAFRIADDVLRQAVQGISDLINVPGIINLDFADVKTIMEGMGVALMGSGTATGENRAVEAAQMAISSPLLEETNINGAKGVLLNIVGGPDLTMNEINEAAMLIHEACDPDAEIIFGAVTDEKMTGSVSVTVIATGFFTPSRDLSEDKNANVLEYFPERGGQRPRPERRATAEHRTLDRGSQTRISRTGDPIRPKDMTRTGDGIRRTTSGQATNVSGEQHEPRVTRSTSSLSSRDHRGNREREKAKQMADAFSDRLDRHDDPKPLRAEKAAEFDTPVETIQEVLLSPQSYGANNLGFDDENDLDIPTYLRNMKKLKKSTS